MRLSQRFVQISKKWVGTKWLLNWNTQGKPAVRKVASLHKVRQFFPKLFLMKGVAIGQDICQISCFVKCQDISTFLFEICWNTIANCFEGLKKLQAWTKQSLSEKPFATAKGKIWTLTPDHIPLKKIHTKLSLVQKERETDEVNRVPLSDITQLFSEETLQRCPSECTRILVTGTCVLSQIFIMW